jgi:hypothetical protein
MAKEKAITQNLAASELGKIRPGTLELFFLSASSNLKTSTRRCDFNRSKDPCEGEL